MLSDEEAGVCELYGVIKPKKMFGKEFKGIERTTLVIDKEGYIVKIFNKVKIENHVNEVLDVLKTNK